MKLVSIIIVNWNGIDHLKKCLPSVYEQNYKNIEVIVVDNSSNDRSSNWIKKNYPKVKLIENKTNLGFAEGNNVGYSIAKGDFVLFLNNDTYVTSNFLTELIKPFSIDKKLSAAQSKILLMDDKERLDSIGAFLTYSGFLYHFGAWKKDSSKYDKQIEIYSAKGACMLVKREVLEKVLLDGNVFDDNFFAYFEETDLCHRIWLSGGKIIFVPSSIIYHKVGATSSKFPSPLIQFHSYKNRINSYIKNLGIVLLVKILPIHLFLCEIVSVVYLITGKWKIFISIQKAILWNILNLRQTLKYRSFIQEKIRKVEDGYIIDRILRNVSLKYYFFLLKGLEGYEEG